MTNWHIITCEYPPQVGGVSDYTRLLTGELRKSGDAVEVWAPAFASDKQEHLHRELGDFQPADLGRASAALDKFPALRTLLVQWVPHGYGRRGINLGFCRWIASRARAGDRVYLMVHEPYLEPTQPSWKLRIVSLLQRRMVRTLLYASRRVFISIPAWENYLAPYSRAGTRFEWLPIPATVPVEATSSAHVRARFAPGSLILGHLGTYSTEITRILQPVTTAILRELPNVALLLLGNRGDAFAAAVKSQAPDLASRICGPGHLSDAPLSHHLAACDLMLQPYPDGLSSRRTSLMNVLAHGLPVVSNAGHLTESLWQESNAVALSLTTESTQLATVCNKLLHDSESRRELAQAGLNLYLSRFDWPNVIAKLRSSPDAVTTRSASTTSNR